MKFSCCVSLRLSAVSLQVVEAAVGEAAEAIEARKLVPLWPDRPLEGQPQVYAKIWKAS